MPSNPNPNRERDPERRSQNPTPRDPDQPRDRPMDDSRRGQGEDFGKESGTAPEDFSKGKVPVSRPEQTR